MNVNAISNLNTSALRYNSLQNKASNPFMMQNGVDTVEFSTKTIKTEPKTKYQIASEKIQEGFAKAGESFKSHVTKGIDVAAQEADKLQQPSEGLTTSHVVANTAVIGQALVGTGSAIIEVAKGVFEAFRALVQK